MNSPIAAQCDSRFRPLLRDFSMILLENSNDIIYGVWPDLTLAFLNAAWFRFAAENRGEPAIATQWTLGRSILDAMPEPLVPFFERNFCRVLAESRRWEHSYECSSDEVQRTFRLTVYPLGNAEGLLLVNSLKVEAPQQQMPSPSLAERYINAHGVITQCCHCRKFRPVGEKNAWDWIPAWVRHMPMPERVSHGLCEMCFGFYYTERKLSGREAQNFLPLPE